MDVVASKVESWAGLFFLGEHRISSRAILLQQVEQLVAGTHIDPFVSVAGC